MSIRFISGKPGGGKTMYSVSLIVEELKASKRVIATNVSLNLNRLCEYLQKEHGTDFNARWRILRLENDQVGEFFRHFSPDAEPLVKRCKIKLPGGKLAERLSYEERGAALLDGAGNEGPGLADYEQQFWWNELARLRKLGRGVLYVLDEVHEFFNSRRWADTGDEVLHYLSQHRKLGDDVICITQSIGNVDKQFRSVAQDFTYVRNHKKESIPFLGGLFRGVGIFSRDTYLEPFTGNQNSIETRTFRLDKTGLASCYDTAAGVGIQGAGADKTEKRSGLHPAWLLAALGVGAWLLWTIPEKVSAKVSGKPAAASSGVAAPAPVVGQVQTLPLPVASVSTVKTGLVQVAVSASEGKLWLRGIRREGHRIWVYLSDGRRLTGSDPELEAAGRDWARVNGRIVRFEPAG